MPRDFQKNKLYKVERIWWDNYGRNKNPKDVEFKDLKQASNYATWIWIQFKMKIYPRQVRKQASRVKCLPVRGGTSTAWSAYYESKSGAYYKKISLSKYHYDFRIVIHEMAHHLAPKSEHHGPIFTKIYMYLLAYYLDYDISYMCQIANEHNLQYSSDDVYLNTNFNKLFEKQKKNWIETEANKLQGVA